MKIDRHNYEEWFILYLDNELSEADRREVEAFALLHPDLGDELDMLLQTRVEPDASLRFNNKETLLKTESESSFNEHNYQEWLLLQTDGELSPEQNIALDRWLGTRPALLKEQEWYQRTRMTADTSVVFPNKELLYRKESKPRLFYISWQRVAVAASLLLVVSTGLWMANRTAGPATPEAGGIAEVVNADGTKSGSTNQATAGTNGTAVPGNTGTSETAVTGSTGTGEPAITGSASPLAGQQVLTDHADRTVRAVVPSTVKRDLADNNVKTENNPASRSNANELPDGSKTNPNLVLPVETNPATALAYNETKLEEINHPAVDALTEQKQINRLSLVTPDNPQPLNPIYASNGNMMQDDGVVTGPGKKNNLRGFLRKITRTFEKTTNLRATNEDDQLLIGGLAIQL